VKKIIVFQIEEVEQSCALSASEIHNFIKSEWIRPYDMEKLSFDTDDINRIKLISELQRQFQVNEESIPIILHLLDQINHLQSLINLNLNEDENEYS
jgi:hypothetical protein